MNDKRFLETVGNKTLEEAADKLGGGIVATVIRLLGSAKNWAKSRIVDGEKGQAQIQADIEFMNRINQQAMSAAKADPRYGILVQVATDDFITKTMRQFENKKGVVKETIKELSSDTEKIKDVKQPGESFMSEFEPYAEKASTEELRQKWGKVLAAEISKPGTISHKAMRIINEIDPEAARLFEEVCKCRIGGAVPVCLVRELTFSERKILEGSDLIISSDLRTMRLFEEAKLEDGKNIWISSFEEYLFGVPETVTIDYPRTGNTAPINWRGSGKPEGVPIYRLTDAGKSLASIFGEKNKENFSDYLAKLSEYLGKVEVMEFKNIDDKWRTVKIWTNGKASTNVHFESNTYGWRGQINMSL